MFKVGTVTKYFEKIKTAMIEVTAPFGVGDMVSFTQDGKTMFNQKIETIKLGYKEIDFTDRDTIVGIKTERPVEPGMEVFRL